MICSDNQKKCRYCDNLISGRAKVCHHCGRDQNKFLMRLGDVGVVVSVFMAVFSIVGSVESGKALGEAKVAATSAAVFRVDDLVNRGYSRILSVEELIKQRAQISSGLEKAGISSKVIQNTVLPITKRIELRQQKQNITGSTTDKDR